MRTDKLIAYGLLNELLVHKKAFQSKANRLFSQVNKFEQVHVWSHTPSPVDRQTRLKTLPFT